MAWVRIDDQAPRNEKMLKAGPAACWLWVCGIAHCQSQLTDGFISTAALPMIGIAGATRAAKLADDLVKAGLFDTAEGGYVVHDYLDFNPSRTVVLKKRAEDAARKRGAESGGTPNGIQADSGAPRAGVPSHPIPSHPKAAADARSKRPIYTSDRFVVFEWQLDDLSRMLGSHLDAFDLHGFFDDLSQRSRRDQLVIPKAETWAWLQEQVLAEVKRRGLPTIGGAAAAKPAGCKHSPPCADQSTHTDRFTREQRAS